MGAMRWLMVAAAVVLFSSVAMATPVISGSASTLDSITWTYTYTIDNTSPDAFGGSVFDVNLPAGGVISNVTAPAGWISSPGSDFVGNAGFINFTTFGATEVAPGASLSGFSFNSTAYPAYWGVAEVTTETAGMPNDIITVSTLVPSPEPTAIIYAITALGLGTGYFGIRTRKSMNK
jgi:hypothetical protein